MRGRISPESDFDTSDSGNGVHVNASDIKFNSLFPVYRFVFTGDGNDVAAVVKPPPPPPGGRSDLKGAVRQQCPSENAGG